jgi:hypothetical protein
VGFHGAEAQAFERWLCGPVRVLRPALYRQGGRNRSISSEKSRQDDKGPTHWGFCRSQKLGRLHFMSFFSLFIKSEVFHFSIFYRGKIHKR